MKHAIRSSCAAAPPASPYSKVRMQALPPVEVGSSYGGQPRGRSRPLIMAAETTLQGID